MMIRLRHIEQSRRCPLCSGQVGDYLIHNIRSKYDFSKHFLTPQRTSPRPQPPLARIPGMRQQYRRRDVRWGRDERRERERVLREADELERAIEKRRWIYRHNLYAKVRDESAAVSYRPQHPLSPACCLQFIHTLQTDSHPSSVHV